MQESGRRVFSRGGAGTNFACLRNNKAAIILSRVKEKVVGDNARENQIP